ncbi:MAG: cysteine desulfurase family protein [Clostridiales bacterium]
MIYLDHSATTPIIDSVFQSMQPFLSQQFGNASTLYDLGREAKEAMEKARESIAHSIGADPEEIYFTSGGTESNNWVIKACCSHSRNHIITTSIEHASVLESCKFLETQGCEITYLPVNNVGLVNGEDIKSAINNKTALVSVMAVNNEVGIIEPINEIAEICSEMKVPFHTDAVQSLENISYDVHKQNISYLTLSAHKIYGPKGVGILYIDKKYSLPPFIHGGGQEYGKRSGTENIAQIVGFAKAMKEITKRTEEKREHYLNLRKLLLENLSHLPITVNSDENYGVPNIINITIEGIDSESLLHLLSLKKIFISSGSACHSSKEEPSHVLLAMNIPPKQAKSTIRISFGQENTAEEIIRTAEVIKQCFGLMKQIKI